MEGTWRAAPDISLRGSFFERSRSSRSKVKFMLFFFFCLFPYFSQVIGPRLRVAPYISSRGSFFKGQGQRSNFCISAVLGPICMKLGECIQVDPLLRFMGPIGSKVKFMFPGPWADLHQTWWEG